MATISPSTTTVLEPFVAGGEGRHQLALHGFNVLGTQGRRCERGVFATGAHRFLPHEVAAGTPTVHENRELRIHFVKKSEQA